MSENAGRILVIRGGAIGDFILTLPVLSAIRAHLPSARLELLAYSNVARLAVTGGLADDVRSIDARPLAQFFARDGELADELRDYFSRFAIVLSYLFDPHGIFEANIRRCSPAQFIAGPHRPDETIPLHATKVFLKPLERLAIFDANPVPRLLPGLGRSKEGIAATSAAENSAGRPWLAFHPGSGSPRKNWPERSWRELIEAVVNKSPAALLIVGGEAEEGRLQRLASGLPAERVRVANGLPLVELAEQLSGCSAFVGHDSGISHLAAALEVSTLVLWGETNEEIWRPLGDHVRLVRSPGRLEDLAVGVVANELDALNQR